MRPFERGFLGEKIAERNRGGGGDKGAPAGGHQGPLGHKSHRGYRGAPSGHKGRHLGEKIAERNRGGDEALSGRRRAISATKSPSAIGHRGALSGAKIKGHKGAPSGAKIKGQREGP